MSEESTELPKKKAPAKKKAEVAEEVAGVAYKVLSPIEYNGVKAKPGEVRKDISEAEAEWLLKFNYIEKAED